MNTFEVCPFSLCESSIVLPPFFGHPIVVHCSLIEYVFFHLCDLSDKNGMNENVVTIKISIVENQQRYYLHANPSHVFDPFLIMCNRQKN
jgi:hypothetical protein